MPKSERARKLKECAKRLAALMKDRRNKGDKLPTEITGLFVGAIHSLLLANHHGYKKDTGDTAQLASWASKLAEPGAAKLDEAFGNDEVKAGYHFNNALLRIAAVYHKALKRLFGKDKGLRPALEKALEKRCEALWSKVKDSHLPDIYTRVNALKHDGNDRSGRIEIGKATLACERLLCLLKRKPFLVKNKSS